VAPLAWNRQAARRAIPWKQVGRGWVLALWGSSPPPSQDGPPSAPVAGETASLYLLDPEGGRYLITTVPLADTPTLGSWSGSGRRALLVGQTTTGENPGTEVTEIDLASGAVQTILLTPSTTVSFTNPHGLALLATTTGTTSVLQRLSADGTMQLAYPTQFPPLGAFNGSSRESPDGTQIAMGTNSGGIALVDNAGHIERNLPVPGADVCVPERWWPASPSPSPSPSPSASPSPSEVLASCYGITSGFSALWLLPTSGAPPSALTVPPPAGSQDAGDQDAWQVGTNTYLQDEGACGYEYLGVLGSGHTTDPVAVPDVPKGESQLVLGAVKNQLLLQTAVACGADISLLWFNPQSQVTKVVLGPGANGGNVMTALLFGDDN
jgi:hypothetical protein